MSRGDEITLLTGASGYVGGRLRRALEAGGRPLRCMARRPEYLRSRAAPAPKSSRATCWIPTRSPRRSAACTPPTT